MYLKRLEMHGFKSFAKKADLNFNSNITIVVGPNGSGKSNIVDAVRWVLGEGSAKSLRGSKMEDVIFAGSTEKKPLGMAQVSLTLDNSTGIFPIDYSEIKITRKLYRSGESEYLINNCKCRQKDIHELIMDTGIGRDSFAIIGQGKVDQILLSQADEKRALIEEVAGISKYRHRKNEAKRKLSDTEQSLLRVKDILAELELQKEPLREQAEKAKEYKGIKNELDDLEVNLSQYAIHNLQQKADNLKETVEKLKKESISKDTMIIKGEAQIQEYSLDIDSNLKDASQIQSQIYELSNGINDYSNKVEFSGKMLDTLKENKEKIKTERTRIVQEIQSLELNQASRLLEYQEIKKEFDSLFKVIQEEEKKIYDRKNAENNVGSKIQDIKGELFDFAHQISENRNRIIDLEKREAVLLSNLEGISRKIQQNSEKKLEKEEELRKIESDKKKIADQLSSYTSKDAEEAENGSILSQRKKLLLEEKGKLTEEITKRQVNKQALEALENNKEGYSVGVRSVFANKNLKGIIGTVADLLETDSRYRLAIETALGASIQNIVTEDEEAAKLAIDFLREKKSGRATFLPLQLILKRHKEQKASEEINLDSALDVIRVDKNYESIFKHLLGGVYIAENMSVALKTNSKLNRPVKIVTVSGEVIDPRGAMTGGSYRNNQEGFLKRKDTIKKLSEEIIEMHCQEKDIEEEIFVLDGKIEFQKSKSEQIKKELADLESQYRDFENLFSQLQFQNSEYLKDNELLSSEKRVAEQDFQDIVREKALKEEVLEKIEKEKRVLEELLAQTQKDSEKEKNNLFDLEKQLSRKEIAFNDIKNSKENKENLLENIKEKIKEIALRDEELQHEELEIAEKIENFTTDKKSYSEKIKNSEIVLNDLEFSLDEKKNVRLALEEKRKNQEEEVKRNRKNFEEIRDKIHSQELLIEKYKTESQGLVESLKERFNISYTRIIHEFFNDFSERNAKQRIRELRKQIEELGEVNLIAISDYEKLLERYTFLKTQCVDLDGAKESLDKIIAEMDHIIKQKFSETFTKLNQSFKETFSEMFNGGMAEIVMTDKDNVLETGIEIIAQPPGKTPKHLSLLSGGEKAMTAICLLFAILKIKPGPFCILDEIEASLDESNVVRFSNFLKKFAQLTQFVVISHRKGTMEAADVLYGVTMEEKGSSSLISVRISETIKLTS